MRNRIPAAGIGARRRVLHVIGKMDRGGAETWLMHVLRAIDRKRFEFHFFVHTSTEGAYDNEIRSLGAHIHYSNNTRNPFQHRRRFKAILDQYGPFDIVHSHVYLYSGLIMRLAAKAGVPVRIAHSHTAPRQKRSNIARLVYERLMRRWLVRYSTKRVGVSQRAAEALFGKRAGKALTVLPYGLDFARFVEGSDCGRLKAQLGIPVTRKIIGHVGRFAPVKNHTFIVEVFQLVIESGVDAHLLFVGDGPLVPAVQKEIESRGLFARCTFAGLQSNVAPFLSTMDVFIFPSLHEGLPLSILEAQAAGVPIISSPATPEEMDVIPGLVRRVPLEEGAAVWAAAVIERLKTERVKTGDEALLLQSSRFAMPMCVERLSRIYEGERIGDLAT